MSDILFPRTEVAGVSLSRMIIGTNWMLGWSHRSPAQDHQIKRKFSEGEKALPMLETFLRYGVDTIMGPLQQELGFSLTRVDKFDMGCGKISSTEIRKLLAEGNVTKAAKLLDYQYFIIGQADHSGQFTPDMPNKIIPGEGIYNVVINGTSHQLLINGDKQLTIKDFNHCQQNIKITFTEKIG